MQTRFTDPRSMWLIVAVMARVRKRGRVTSNDGSNEVRACSRYRY